MAGNKKELIELIKKYRLGKASAGEIIFLEKYYQYFDKEEKVSEALTENEIKETGNKIFAAIQSGMQQAPVVPIYRRLTFRIAAASVLLIIAFGTYYLNLNKAHYQSPETNAAVVKHDDVAPPALNRATITLANGKKVYLDSARNGMLAAQGSVSLKKIGDGQIVYNSESAAINNEVVYNTLTNPKGSKVIDMTLSDGSRVWLNAGSSVTYPVLFGRKERNVSMTGEAYFEVARNMTNPFKVSKGKVEIAVLGTHFNVNAYDDEREIKVTLLEGSVKVLRQAQDDKAVIIKPGEQAQVSNDIKVVKDADVDEVMAWKNGVFKFKEASIESLMRQVEKWYDVEINYEGKVNSHFVATIPRTVSVSNVFKILEATGGVHFRIEGRKVTVMP